VLVQENLLECLSLFYLSFIVLNAIMQVHYGL